MRIHLMTACVLTLLMAHAGPLQAQTANVQQTTEIKLALRRLRGGVRIGDAMQSLAQVPLEDAVRSFQWSERTLRRLFDQLVLPSNHGMLGRKNP